MQGIREFNNKIKSLKNTLKITSSMKMVSTVKLQKFSRTKQSAVAFSQSVNQSAKHFSNVAVYNTVQPSQKGKPVSKSVILFFTSDRGLCGRYNANVFREALKLSEKLKRGNITSSFSCVGQKGYAYLMRIHLSLNRYYNGVAAHPDITGANTIAQDCVKKFRDGEIEELYLVYTRRKSSMNEEVVAEKVLPLTVETAEKDDRNGRDFICESSPEEYRLKIEEMKTLSNIYKALVEAAESEHSSRMNAMDTATTNCKRMIQHYQQLRNRARQTAITTELSEIVTGKEALEG